MKYRSDLDIEINGLQEQLILGTLLGDGSCVLQKGAANPYLRISHSLKDLPYTEWKYHHLLSSGLLQSPIDKYGSFSSVSHPVLWQYRSLFYPNGGKVVTREILDMLDPFAVAVWYMDDGSIVRKISRSPGPYCIMATQSFTLDENQIIKDWFEDRFAVEFRVYPKRKKGYSRLYPEMWTTRIAEGRKFFRIVDRYIPECMSRKKAIVT